MKRPSVARRHAWLLAALTFAGPAAAQPVPDAASMQASPAMQPSPTTQPLSEEQVVELALRAHPTLQAALSSERAAQAGYEAVQWSRLPNLSVSGRVSRLSGIPERYRSFDGFVFPQLLTNLGVRAQLSVPLSESLLNLAHAAHAAGRERDAARLERQTARAQLAYEARLALLDCWRRSLAVQTAEELLQAASRNAEDQRSRAEAGTVARNDVLAFDTQVDSARMVLHSARGELQAAEAWLRTFVPQLGDAPLVLPALPAHDGASPSAAPREAPSSTPQLEALEARTDAAKARARQASWARLPQLSGLASADLSAPSPRVFVMDRLVAVPSWELGATLEWSLSQLTEGSARAAQARHEHELMQARLAEAKQRLRAERLAALAQWRAAGEQLDSATARVERAAHLAEARRGELEAGSALPLNVVLAESDLARAKNERVEAFVARASARARLDFVDGRASLSPATPRKESQP